MTYSLIEWTDATWNPTRGCSRVSEGCRNCYAERVARRFSRKDQPYEGFTRLTQSGPRWTGRVELIRAKLDEPLSWRKPRRIFVNSMSDLFHEGLSNEAIAAVFGIMAAARRHTFLLITKRAYRMREWFRWVEAGRPGASTPKAILAQEAAPLDQPDRVVAAEQPWPLANVWLGVSVEDQATADARIPELLATPAAVRFVSYEPALGPVDFAWLRVHEGDLDALRGSRHDDFESSGVPTGTTEHLDWIIIGGESGPGARPFDVAWARSTIAACREAGVACFMKQLGSNPTGRWRTDSSPGITICRGCFDDRRAADPYEWPFDLQVREFPRVTKP